MNTRQNQQPVEGNEIKIIPTLALYHTLFLLVLFSCDSFDKSSSDNNDLALEEGTEYRLLIEAGFEIDRIIDKGPYYLVEEDIIIEKERLRALARKNGNGRTGQWTHEIAGRISYPDQSCISIRIEHSAQMWREHIEAAIGFWNDVEDSRLNFYITDGNNADITIHGVDLPAGHYGGAFLPNNGKPGSHIELNNDINELPVWRVRTTIAHELGHTVGLLHSDSPGLNARRVPGSPASDASSIMNSGAAANRNDPTLNHPVSLWPGFSAADYYSIKILYPEDYSGDRLYNSDFYVYGNPDVDAAYGGNLAAIKSHWENQGGPVEGRAGSPLFDPNFYRSIHPDFLASSMSRSQAITHWLNTGANEGRESSLVFDVRFYLANNPDLRLAYGTTGFQKAYQHWINTGIFEGRAASARFNPRNYLNRYPDLQSAFGTNFRLATFHWYFYGRHEGRIGT